MFKWLINARGKEKDSVHYLFLKEFINYLKDMKFIETDDVDLFIDDFANDITMENCTCENCKQMDICFSSEKANFICTIENKLDAKINTDTTTNKTQIEYYTDYINKAFENYKIKLFLFLSCNDITSKTLGHSKICGKKTIHFGDSEEDISDMTLC